MDVLTLQNSKSYTNLVVLGLTGISVSGTTVTFTLTDGSSASVTVPTPDDGVSVSDVEINASKHLICTLSNGTTIDAGEIPTVKGDKGDNGEDGLTVSVNNITQVDGDISVNLDNIPDGTARKLAGLATESYVNNAIGNVNSFSVQVVYVLPTENIDLHTIYFVPRIDGEGNDIYDEYMYINSAWEHIGTSAVDLSDYYTKTEVNTLIAGVGGNTYSTSETVCGTWIDGKPIYRRVFYSATSWNDNETLDTILTVDIPIRLSVICKTIGNSYYDTYGDVIGGGGSSNVSYNDSTKTLTYHATGVFATQYPALIIFEYTKTTD